jgi:hypothetical protein
MLSLTMLALPAAEARRAHCGPVAALAQTLAQKLGLPSPALGAAGGEGAAISISPQQVWAQVARQMSAGDQVIFRGLQLGNIPAPSPSMLQWVLEQNRAAQAPFMRHLLPNTGSSSYLTGALTDPAVAASLAAAGAWQQAGGLLLMNNLGAGQQSLGFGASWAHGPHAGLGPGWLGGAAGGVGGSMVPGMAFMAGEALGRSLCCACPWCRPAW